MKKRIHQSILTILLLGLGVVFPQSVAAKGQVLGVHILAPGEIRQAEALLEGETESTYLTVPFTKADINKTAEWQAFFDECHDRNITPIVRLTTAFADGHWQAPTRSDIMRFASALSALDWHKEDLRVVVFNEPNHASEWDGRIDPTEFGQLSAFAADWFHTEPKRYIVLPAGLDLSADGHGNTMEAFAFWKEALASSPGLFDKLDGWTSHSYPNPDFSSNPRNTDKRSLRGYQHELTFISHYTQKQLPVYITETGWDQRPFSTTKLRSYYRQAFEQIWNKDERVVAVTPFLLQGAPGAFSAFSFLDEAGKPTKTYEAFRAVFSPTN